MFVPSLSWLNVRFYIQMAQRDRFYSLNKCGCLQAPPVPSNDPLEMAGGGGGSGGGGSSCYSLGPPMYTAEIESDQGRPAFVARDGTFELAYW
jgi:hypothetical protein